MIVYYQISFKNKVFSFIEVIDTPCSGCRAGSPRNSIPPFLFWDKPLPFLPDNLTVVIRVFNALFEIDEEPPGVTNATDQKPHG